MADAKIGTAVVQVKAGTEGFEQTLRVISKHLTALADDLASIRNAPSAPSAEATGAFMSATPVTSTQLTGGSQPGTVIADPAPTAIDTTNGNAFTNSGITMFRIQNTDTASHTLTLLTPVTEGGLALSDDPRTIPASSTKWIGRLPQAVYGSKLQMTCTSSMVEVTAFEP